MVFRQRDPGRSPTRDAEGPMTGERMLVDCVVRSDAPQKSGGDTVQLRQYAAHLAVSGVDFRELPFHPAMRFRDGAIVHIFNVDRPFDYVIASRLAAGHRIVVSPIHHSLARVRAMRAGERGRGIRTLVGRVLPEAAREWLGTLVRALRSNRDPRAIIATLGAGLRTLLIIRSVWHHAGRALDAADAVALLADGEGDDLQALTGWRRRNAALVPNGMPEDVDLAQRLAWADRAPEILVVGRIEPRKRPLELARAADEARVSVTFIGERTEAGNGYTAEFDALAARSPFVHYAGPMPRAEVLRRMGSARVLLNGSWAEVQSLVDLEAACMGCAVVSSGAGHSGEWLGGSIAVVEGDALGPLMALAHARAHDADAAPGPVSYDWTWERTSRRLLELYRGPGHPDRPVAD